jgi:hypothetical protein
VICYLPLWTIFVSPMVIISVGKGNFKQAGIVGGSEEDKGNNPPFRGLNGDRTAPSRRSP